MRELDKPTEVFTDPKATEMARVWIANKELHVALLLGMWADALQCKIDERDAWGELLADLTRHIAHGLEQSHGWDKVECMRRIAEAYENALEDDANVEGRYPGEPH
jgi:predicted secreted Zn-dependent protease